MKIKKRFVYLPFFGLGRQNRLEGNFIRVLIARYKCMCAEKEVGDFEQIDLIFSKIVYILYKHVYRVFFNET